MESTTRRKTGRPSKGARSLVQGRVPLDLAARFRDDADARGQSDADRLAEILKAYYELSREAHTA